jgi:hypothetical protein
VERKYEQLYEERVNPFSVFRARQQEERVAAMGTQDKLALHLGRLVFTKKSVRNVIFAYSLALHLLVCLHILTLPCYWSLACLMYAT